jgi:hypothetical protein
MRSEGWRALGDSNFHLTSAQIRPAWGASKSDPGIIEWVSGFFHFIAVANKAKHLCMTISLV